MENGNVPFNSGPRFGYISRLRAGAVLGSTDSAVIRRDVRGEGQPHSFILVISTYGSKWKNITQAFASNDYQSARGYVNVYDSSIPLPF